ncbi:glycoside hydrolase [Gilvimarinus xylanilyticus]|uniref:Glycoside hydrolase n=1 Tax=Gilvimarinus xylanilyticus TaxID=2944139 RepID=A0A9X2I439_9GAMM|nr:glycoside hydrolase [Gilvimarinus xylanilyticus]MCP8900005.1 glycoside hydrolase [Gilvimarinus xylanilyticus]
MLTLLSPPRWYARLKRHYTARAGTVSSPSDIVVEHSTPVQTVDTRYLSFSIDISVLVGGYWWEGSDSSKRGLGMLRVPPIQLKQKKLDRLVSQLGPSYLRVGGSEADKIHYFSAPDTEPDALVLTRKQWDRLNEFVQRHDLRLIFTVKYGLFARQDHGQWRGDELKELLEYSCSKHYQIAVFELGNELNAYWAFHGLRAQPKARDLAIDYATFTRQVRQYYPQAKISGPGSAFWPRLGETFKPFSNITRRFLQQLPMPLDIVNWHYYPFQSSRSPVRTRAATVRTMLNPKSFADFDRYSRTLIFWRDRYQPRAQLWTGESGSAQCGGQPKLSDRFISSFWWADQLGQGALLGHKVMVRQSLIGGDYGLIDRLTLKPRPDYWVSWLWVRLMGPEVYQSYHSDKHLRVYCHRHPNSEQYTLMIINLKPRGIRVNVDLPGHCQNQYTLTAKRLTSRKVYINQVRAKLKKGEVTLEDFTQAPQSNRVPGYSISFWCYTLDK